MLPRRHLHTLKIERVLLATLQIVHVKSGDDLLPLDHIAGVDRSLQCARFQANRRCFRVLGIRSAGTARKTSRRANQADGCHHEVATIEALSLFLRHGELSSTLCTRVTNLAPGFERSQGVTFATARQLAMVTMMLATRVQTMVPGLATENRIGQGLAR